MKTKFIILLTIFLFLAIPNKVLANPPDIQNIIWENDYTVKFTQVENASTYKYSFSVNTSKAPTTLFTINNFKRENETILFFPEEALAYFSSDNPAVYRVWIVAVDKNNNNLTALTQSKAGKILISANLIKAKNNTIEEIKPPLPASSDSNILDETSSTEEKIQTNKEVNETTLTSPTTCTWENPFKDVSDTAWYYQSIKYTNENNLLSGITDTEFAPKSPMTRGMLAYVLYKHSKDDSKINPLIAFSDVKETAYYSDAISWMRKNNISAGMGKNKFNPSDPVTREQLMTILYNYSIYLGKEVKSEIINFNDFSDSENIHQWAKVPLCWAIKNNLIGGRTENTLAPREATTRAEFATILMRYLKS